MTTQSDQPVPAAATPHLVAVRDVTPCLLWAGFSLAVLAFWLWARGLDVAAPFYLGTGALALAALALYFWTFLKGRTTPRAELDSQLRPVLTAAMLITGGVLLLLAIWLCLVATEKLQLFAEISSLAVMGLICLGGAFVLRLTPSSWFSRQVFFQQLVIVRPQLGIGLAVVGLILACLGGYLLISAGWSNFAIRYGPEGLGLLFIGLALLGGGLFTMITQDRPATSDTMRLLLLYIGSLTGLSIALCTALRIMVWWREYFAGGIQTWQGADGWRFWLCAYVELFGLLLLFGSLLLARVDIRVNVGMRRLLYGYNAVFTGILLLAVLVVLNIIVFVKLPSSVQWNETLGLHSLSGASKLILSNLKDKVTVYFIMPRNSGTFQEVRNLLDNCQGITNKLVVEYMSPDLDPVRFRKLVKTYPEIDKQLSMSMDRSGGSGLLVVYGEGSEDKQLPHAFLTDKDLEDADMDPRTGRQGPGSFKGEKALMQAIQMLSENKVKPKVYFSQGYGEVFLNDFDQRMITRWEQYWGASEIASRLRKDNYEVMGLVWDVKPSNKKVSEFIAFSQKAPGEKHEIPDDCRVLVIVDPDKAYSKEIGEAIDRYMDKANGKLMILTRAGILSNAKFAEDGMEELCKKYNVQVTNDFVISYSSKSAMDVFMLKATVPRGSQNKVAREFSKNFLLFCAPRTVRPLKGPSPYQADTILQVEEDMNIWAETEPYPFVVDPLAYVNDLRRKNKLEAKLSPEPLPVGVAFTDREGKPRGMVLGDYMFITTEFMSDRSPLIETGYNFFRSSLEWLADRPVPVIGIPPVERRIYSIDQSVNGPRLVLLPMGLLVLMLGGLGAGIWIVRRK